jgi:hypothetical protein
VISSRDLSSPLSEAFGDEPGFAAWGKGALDTGSAIEAAVHLGSVGSGSSGHVISVPITREEGVGSSAAKKSVRSGPSNNCVASEPPDK